ncbi:hypothetical protein H4Q32_022305 [Labeo rohita]|uniref:Uncharacterized protein n=1 Tax=Labeo rohita TaxID=84645 RepID=A0ABQ8MA71_LABRO|nr:hypothetical protein H4Q32_022305 [Labeo rohita]
MILFSSLAEHCLLEKDMTLKPHERRQNQAGPLRKKKPGRVPNGLSLDLHKDRLNHNNHQHHHSDQENNPRLAHTHSKKKKYLQKKPRPVPFVLVREKERERDCTALSFIMCILPMAELKADKSISHGAV